MSLFTSDRERRLWFWALAVMAAIYTTLGSTRALVDALRERNLLRLSLALLVILVVTAFFWQWVRTRPGRSEIGVALGVAFAYWLAFIRLENPAERTHLVEYGIVAALIHQALLERARNNRPVARPAALTVAATALLGLVDEGIQLFLPSRVFDWNDVFFNAFAGFMVIVARLALAPVRRPGWRLWFLWLLAGGVGWGWSMDPGVFGEPRLFVLVEALPPVNLPRLMNVVVGAVLVGMLQALLLRRYLAGAGRWAAASVAAAALTAVLFWGVGLLDPDLGWAAAAGLYGLLAGVLQWLVLRPLARSGWWVPTSAAAWLVTIPFGDAMGPPGWALFAAATGAVLVWLLRR